MLYYSGEHLRHARVRAPPGQYLARKAMGPQSLPNISLALKSQKCNMNRQKLRHCHSVNNFSNTVFLIDDQIKCQMKRIPIL